jgi:hypothetical protein
VVAVSFVGLGFRVYNNKLEQLKTQVCIC